jgi:hypothetical protein
MPPLGARAPPATWAPDLPADVLARALLFRLPLADLMRSQGVSKAWRDGAGQLLTELLDGHLITLIRQNRQEDAVRLVLTPYNKHVPQHHVFMALRVVIEGSRTQGTELAERLLAVIGKAAAAADPRTRDGLVGWVENQMLRAARDRLPVAVLLYRSFVELKRSDVEYHRKTMEQLRELAGHLFNALPTDLAPR